MDTRLLRQTPLYTVSDAARFTGARPVDVRRWVEGYVFRGKWQSSVSQHASRTDGLLYLSFHHLIEVWAINRMRRPLDHKHALPLQRIRKAALEARRRYDEEFPLADERLRWDGAGIFYESLGEEVVDEGLVELSKKSGQMVWSAFIADGLQRIEYADQVAVRLWPLGRDHSVVMDPAIRDGWPVVAHQGDVTGVPAEVVAEMVRAGEDVAETAKAYRLSERDVQDAIEFVEAGAGLAA